MWNGRCGCARSRRWGLRRVGRGEESVLERWTLAETRVLSYFFLRGGCGDWRALLEGRVLSYSVDLEGAIRFRLELERG